MPNQVPSTSQDVNMPDAPVTVPVPQTPQTREQIVAKRKQEFDNGDGGQAKRITGTKSTTGDNYLLFKKWMTSFLTTAGLPTDIDLNCMFAGNAVCAIYSKSSEIISSKKVTINGYRWLDQAQGLIISVENVVVDVSTLINIITNISVDQRKLLSPFICCVQLASKTYDMVLWQNNKQAKLHRIPPQAYPFAVGFGIQNKLKKSRPLSIGPIAHLMNIYEMNSRASAGKNRGRISNSAYTNIRKEMMKIMNRQLISPTQKSMASDIIHEVGNVDETFRTLAASMVAIKPHIEHQFCLPYPAIMGLDDASFEGATFTSEWPFKALSKTVFYVATASAAQWEFYNTCWIYGAFQAMHENLNVLKMMFNEVSFPKRNSIGQPFKAKTAIGAKKFHFAYQLWSKPQKGAPINIEGRSISMPVTRPSFRGQRPAYLDKDINLISLAGGGKPGMSLMETLQAEATEYANQAMEGTGKFYLPGGEAEIAQEQINQAITSVETLFS